MQMSNYTNDEFDEDGILRDGRSVRVPLHLRDGHNSRLSDVQRQIAASRHELVDVFGNRAGHRPGFAFANDAAARDAKAAAYRDYHRDIENAWRGSASTAHEEGSEAVPLRADGRSVSQITRDHRQHMAQLYDEHDRELSEMWRSR
jgi:hypothetical protein